MHVDVVIVGQGLAGSILAWHLIQKSLDVLVIDDNHQGASSLAAAGLMNPITGKRLVKSWQVDQCLPVALQFYRTLETTLGRPLYYQKRILRLFSNAEERALWNKRRSQSAYRDYLGDIVESNKSHQSRDGFYIRHSGYLDTKELLWGVKTYLQQRNRLMETPLSYADIRISGGEVRWKDITAERLVFCEGHRMRENPWFSRLPLQLAQGEILTVKTVQPLPKEIINGGKWLVPIEPNTLKIGATFQWQPIDGVPTSTGKQELLDAGRLLGWDSCNDDVVEHVCGVRPGTSDKKPFIGSHPRYPRLSVFNGFGAKGSLLIPYFAALFADCLCGSVLLPDEVDIRRFGF